MPPGSIAQHPDYTALPPYAKLDELRAALASMTIGARVTAP